jgi:thiol-disulfide isomerase/thioredoxin
MKHLKTILVSTLIAAMLYYEYDTGGFHRLYIRSLLLSNNKVVVMYGAEWCPACTRLIGPTLTCFNQAGLIKLVHVDIDKEPVDKYGALTPYIPMISVYNNTEDGSSGLQYQGLFPSTKNDMMFILFDGAYLDKKVIDYCLRDLYKEVTQPQTP